MWISKNILKKCFAFLMCIAILFISIMPVGAEEEQPLIGDILEGDDNSELPVPLPNANDIASLLGSFASGAIGVGEFADALGVTLEALGFAVDTIGSIVNFFSESPEEKLSKEIVKSNEQLSYIKGELELLNNQIYDSNVYKKEMTENVVNLNKVFSTSLLIWLFMLVARFLWKILWGWSFSKV